MSAPSKPPSPSRRTHRARRLQPTEREQRAKYLRSLPDLNAPELELVLGLWDDLGEDMRGVRIRWMDPEAPTRPPEPHRIAPLLSVPPLPEGCAGEADEAGVAPRAGELPLVIELEGAGGEPTADLDWADLAGDEEWVAVEALPDPATPVPEQLRLF